MIIHGIYVFQNRAPYMAVNYYENIYAFYSTTCMLYYSFQRIPHILKYYTAPAVLYGQNRQNL